MSAAITQQKRLACMETAWRLRPWPERWTAPRSEMPTCEYHFSETSPLSPSRLSPAGNIPLGDLTLLTHARGKKDQLTRRRSRSPTEAAAQRPPTAVQGSD